jgi:hypothetical protein
MWQWSPHFSSMVALAAAAAAAGQTVLEKWDPVEVWISGENCFQGCNKGEVLTPLGKV